LQLVVIAIGERDIAGLAAIRTIVKAIDAQANVLLRLAKAAVFFASASPLRLIALRAERLHSKHPRVRKQIRLESIVGYARAHDKRLSLQRLSLGCGCNLGEQR
jgi:hypothetical protein